MRAHDLRPEDAEEAIKEGFRRLPGMRLPAPGRSIHQEFASQPDASFFSLLTKNWDSLSAEQRDAARWLARLSRGCAHSSDQLAWSGRLGLD